MKITSSAFKNNSSIPARYTCQGENINPPLSWSDIPKATESLVLIVDDPDAPDGAFVHWLVWNISPDTREIAENSVPEEAVKGTNSGGQTDYMGPCPPSGTHRYFFKIYALDTKLSLPSGENKESLREAIEGHVLGRAQLIGRYQKS